MLAGSFYRPERPGRGRGLGMAGTRSRSCSSGGDGQGRGMGGFYSTVGASTASWRGLVTEDKKGSSGVWR
jgi:hypothetical protein